MVAATRNEAAELVRAFVTANDIYLQGMPALLDAALAAERRITVERIKDRLLATAPHDGCDGSHQFCDPEAMPPSPVVWAILDEEASR